MSQGLREIQPYDLTRELETVLLPRLVSHLRSKAPGHCMRLSDLDHELMVQLCGRLRAEVEQAQVVILDAGLNGSIPPEFGVSSTKLVELRNPLADGTQRPPLLVFIPHDLRAAAEDSFGVATFEEIQLGDIYADLRDALLADLPSHLRGVLGESLQQLRNGNGAESEPWPFADGLSVARFLLTAHLNDYDPPAIGAALFELGLVPDFELLDQPERAPSRIQRNQQCVRKLTWSAKSERGRVLDLELSNRGFRTELGNFLAEVGLEDPKSWTRRIVRDRERWPFAFQRWTFEDSGDLPDAVCISNVTTKLPIMEDDGKDDALSQLVGQQFLQLGKKGLTKFSATFQVEPHPSKVQGLTKFVAQIVSVERGPVGIARNKKPWKAKKAETTVSFSKLSKGDWEEGWHFIRVLAYGDDNNLIPLVDPQGNPLPWLDESDEYLPRPNQSDLFYVLPEGDVEFEPPQRAIQREESLIHAWLRLQFTALIDDRDPLSIAPTGAAWSEGKSSVGSEMLQLKFGREGSINIPVSRPLKELEQQILGEPAGPLAWRMTIRLGEADSPSADLVDWPQGAAVDRFLAARSAYFGAVRSGYQFRDDSLFSEPDLANPEHADQQGSSQTLISQSADFLALRPLVVDYADAYVQAIQSFLWQAQSSSDAESQVALSDLRKLLALDTITLIVLDHRGQRREAALVAPTHPLRALWLATWAELGQQWLRQTMDATEAGLGEFAVPTRDALMRTLAPIGFPPVLPTSGGRLLTTLDNLHPYWTLYAPPGEENPRGLIGQVFASLGLPEPSIGGAAIDGAYLASRIQRYLVQHPYVRTLIINAFNPGRATVLADMLLALQKQPAFQDIRYDIRLFVPDPDAPGVGEALTALLSPSGSLTAKEADAFATPTESHLRPKLGLAIRSTSEFRQAPTEHAAHLSLLYDIFPAEEVGVMSPPEQETAAPIHGLVQPLQVSYREDDDAVVWQRQPRHGLALALPQAEELTDLLSSLPGLLSTAAAAAATSQAGAQLQLVITLALDREERALLHQVHDISDWVLTLDRNMGIEFFDHGGLAGRPDYLIDHSPDMVSGLGHRLFITSRSVTELEAMLQPTLELYNLRADGRHAVAVLDQLRSLSGRLAFKLLSAPNQQAEALGLALSRMYLEHQGVFANQVVVPLDAHVDLYRSVSRQTAELGDDISFKRTDLALFDLNAATRTLTCRLVEVKCYTQVGDVGAFNQLKSSIFDQICQSEEILRVHFDPSRTAVDRPDRLVKSRELVNLLGFYLDRSQRYGIIAPDAADEARYFLETLEDGYQLAFTRAALIFDFEKAGTDPVELENGIEFHRIGIDLIGELISSVATTHSETTSAELLDETAESITERRGYELHRRRERTPSVPELTEAAFLSPPRDHTVEWADLLDVRRTTNDDLLEEPPIEPETEEAAPAKPEAEQAIESPVEAASQPAQPEPAAEPPTVESSADLSVYDIAPVFPEDEEIEQQIGLIREEKPPYTVETPDEPSQNVAGLPTVQSTEEQAMATDEPPSAASSEPAAPPAALGPAYDVILGATADSPQFGLLGEFSSRKVAIDLNQTHTISLFGVQGGGKSYTLGTIAEMASLPIAQINQLPQPLATVIFHYSPTMDYEPEFTSMIAPNSDEGQLQALRERYGAEPQALEDMVLLVPEDKLDERRAEFPSVEVHPLKFAARELQAGHWRFLMGAVGNQANYIRQLNRIMKGLRHDLTIDNLRQGIDDSRLPDNLKEQAHGRLDLAAEYIDDSLNLSGLIRPGRLIIVDLRDEFIEKDEALGLFVVLLQLFADATFEGQKFNKLVVFDEAHKYIESPDLVAGLIEVVREMRHKGTSILVASQDPPSVPISLIELSSQIILHKFNSPAWLKHIQKANAALSELSAAKMAELRAGEAYVWSSKATDEAFSRGTVKVRCRPRVTQHGGATKTAV